MKKIIIVSLLLIESLLVGCNSQYKTLDEAIHKAIPYEIKEVIHTESVQDGTIVLFTTRPKNRPFDALGIAFIKGSDLEGWKLIEGSTGWKHMNNDDMTVYYENFIVPKGDKNNTIPITFGQINNTNIQMVEVANQSDREFTNIDIIESTADRFYFTVGYHLIVRGLSKQGEIIIQHGGY